MIIAKFLFFFFLNPFSKCSLSTLKRYDDVFKFVRFKERFGKIPFSWLIRMDGRPYSGTKVTFSSVDERP